MLAGGSDHERCVVPGIGEEAHRSAGEYRLIVGMGMIGRRSCPARSQISSTVRSEFQCGENFPIRQLWYKFRFRLPLTWLGQGPQWEPPILQDTETSNEFSRQRHR